MDYATMCGMLKELGVWAPVWPSKKAKRLRCGGEPDGRPIPGAFLNESVSGRAFITLNVNTGGGVDFSANIRFCDSLSPGRWRDLAVEDLPDHLRGKPHRRHLYPADGVERDALREFTAFMCR
ncbi:MAG: hypothetical protein OXL97_12430 [Chloroflexota bacterium]|nr:hypothetical protein [Chloroflexota bacterium]MDE2883886.1 hypothetical protein [Chloroflexota bacterium]